MSATQFLENLLTEINAFDGDLFPPRDEREEKEVVLGDCPVELRKYLSFIGSCSRDIDQAKVDLKYSNDEDKKSLYGHMAILDVKKRIAQHVFTGCLAEHFKDWWQPGHLVVRKGWVVVRCSVHHPAPEISGLLRGLGFPFPEE